jgi:hypothetical protein
MDTLLVGNIPIHPCLKTYFFTLFTSFMGDPSRVRKGNGGYAFQLYTQKEDPSSSNRDGTRHL